ncbi:MAG TPA: FtsX-like permease family protein, partial [Vicinamibacterales bacterium]
VNPGFDTAHTVTMRVSLPTASYREPGKRTQFYDRVFGRVDALPGVVASGATSFLPLTGLGAATGFSVVGRPEPAPGEGPVCDVRSVGNHFFKAMSVPLIKGRLFDDGDPTENKGRVIINETMARQYWPNEDPIGKRVKISWGENVEDEIIGVVGDVHHAGLDQAVKATVYWPYGRLPYPTMTMAVRTVGDPRSISNAVAAVVREQDPALAVADIKTMADVVSSSVAQQRLTMMLLAVFAVAALLLAAVGIYGVISYSVTQRTQEIGIRMALGAQRAEVLRMIVGQALVLALIGIAIGAGAAFLLTRLMTGMLYDVTHADPLTFVSVAAMLGVVAAVASYVPGRRATRVDPVIALRAE